MPQDRQDRPWSAAEKALEQVGRQVGQQGQKNGHEKGPVLLQYYSKTALVWLTKVDFDYT